MGGDGDFPGMMVKKELPLIVNTDIRLVDPSRSASFNLTLTNSVIPIPILHLGKIFGN